MVAVRTSILPAASPAEAEWSTCFCGFWWARTQEASYIPYPPTTDYNLFPLDPVSMDPNSRLCDSGVSLSLCFLLSLCLQPFLGWCLDFKSPSLWFDQSLHFHPLLLYWPESPTRAGAHHFLSVSAWGSQFQDKASYGENRNLKR